MEPKTKNKKHNYTHTHTHTHTHTNTKNVDVYKVKIITESKHALLCFITFNVVVGSIFTNHLFCL